MNESTRRRGRNAAGAAPLPLACIRSLLFGLLAAVLLLLIAVALTYAQSDPSRFATPASLVTLYLAVSLTGFLAARASDSPVLAGGICGAVWLVLVLLLSLIAGGDGGCGFGTLGTLLARASIPIASVLGALIGKKRTKRASSHRKKRRR